MATFKVVGWVNFSSNMSKSFQDGRKEYFPLKSSRWRRMHFLDQLKQMHCIATQADALPYEQIAQTFQGVSRETMGYKRPEETPAYTSYFSSNQSTNQPMNKFFFFKSNNYGTQTTQFFYLFTKTLTFDMFKCRQLVWEGSWEYMGGTYICATWYVARPAPVNIWPFSKMWICM